jgi:hypothetical protein
LISGAPTHVIDWIEFGLKAFVHFILMNKQDEMEFNALPWTILGPILVVAQIIFLTFFNDFFAGGNILLLVLEGFTIV